MLVAGVSYSRCYCLTHDVCRIILPMQIRIQTSLSKLISKNIKTGQDTVVDGSTNFNNTTLLLHLSTCLHVYKESGKCKYDEILGRISQTTTLADARDCDLIIEVGPQTV